MHIPSHPPTHPVVIECGRVGVAGRICQRDPEHFGDRTRRSAVERQLVLLFTLSLRVERHIPPVVVLGSLVLATALALTIGLGVVSIFFLPNDRQI